MLILSIITNIIMQLKTGSEMKMSHMSTRIAFFCTMVSSFLIYNYYSASIVSTRFSEPIFKLNDSLNELAKTQLKFSSEPMVYFEFLLKVISIR